MKKWPQQWVAPLLILTAGSACFGVGLDSLERTPFKPAQWAAVSEESLGNTRGGYEAASGLTVSFGIVRTITINGDLISRTSFNLPDVTRITPEQAQMAHSVLSDVAVIQNGTGNAVDATIKSQLAAGTIIQNSLNDQKIQTLTIINAGVNSLGLMKAMNAQAVQRDAMLGAISAH